MRNSAFNPRVIGISPLGNNAHIKRAPGFLEGGFLSDEGFLEQQSESTREVPLVYDHITGLWVAKLSRTNQEDRLIGLETARRSMEDQSFLARAGYVQK